ncbi:nucleoside phosphorylase [Planctomycetota bacterium]
MKKDRAPLFNWPLKGKVWIDPQFELKHERRFKELNRGSYPTNCIICYQDYFIKAAIDKYQARFVEKILGRSLYEFKYNNQRMGIIQSTVGAPVVALCIERLIAMGIKRFLNIGIAGALTDQGINPGDLVLCTKALRNEGTSYHYQKPARYALPDRGLTARAEAALKASGIDYKKGPTITLDVPYRFPVSKARELRREGVVTSDMEAAAVFAISKFRKVKSAAIFTISDLATNDFKWVPKFHAQELRQGMENLFKICVNVMGSMR